MMISHTIFFKIALITSGGNDRLITHFKDSHILIDMFRIFDGNIPVTSIRLCPDGLYISSQT